MCVCVREREFGLGPTLIIRIWLQVQVFDLNSGDNICPEMLTLSFNGVVWVSNGNSSGELGSIYTEPGPNLIGFHLTVIYQIWACFVYPKKCGYVAFNL